MEVAAVAAGEVPVAAALVHATLAAADADLLCCVTRTARKRLNSAARVVVPPGGAVIMPPLSNPSLMKLAIQRRLKSPAEWSAVWRSPLR